MEFNFDSSEHIAYVSSPSAKAINAPAGIWVGFDNQQALLLGRRKRVRGRYRL